jgi:hypothetical protein
LLLLLFSIRNSRGVLLPAVRGLLIERIVARQRPVAMFIDSACYCCCFRLKAREIPLLLTVPGLLIVIEQSAARQERPVTHISFHDDARPSIHLAMVAVFDCEILPLLRFLAYLRIEQSVACSFCSTMTAMLIVSSCNRCCFRPKTLMVLPLRGLLIEHVLEPQSAVFCQLNSSEYTT